MKLTKLERFSSIYDAGVCTFYCGVLLAYGLAFDQDLWVQIGYGVSSLIWLVIMLMRVRLYKIYSCIEKIEARLTELK